LCNGCSQARPLLLLLLLLLLKPAWLEILPLHASVYLATDATSHQMDVAQHANAKDQNKHYGPK